MTSKTSGVFFFDANVSTPRIIILFVPTNTLTFFLLRRIPLRSSPISRLSLSSNQILSKNPLDIFCNDDVHQLIQDPTQGALPYQQWSLGETETLGQLPKASSLRYISYGRRYCVTQGSRSSFLQR